MAGAIVVDSAWTKPTVQQLHSWNAVAWGGYLSHDPSKNANKTLVAQYAGGGIKTLLFAEDTAQESAGGHAAGVSKAQFAAPLAQACGMPNWAPIIATCDWDVPDYAPTSTDPRKKLGPIGDYLQGWNDVIGVSRTAVYGDYWVVSRAIQSGLAAFGIQTIAWSGGKVFLRDVACLQNGQMLDGGQVDVEVILSSDLLGRVAWVPGEPNPAAPAPKPPPLTGFSWSQWLATQELHYGQGGNSIGVLQTALRRSGIPGVRGIMVDKIFGPQTLTAVRNFQYVKFGEKYVDGIAGPQTHKGLVALNDL